MTKVEVVPKEPWIMPNRQKFTKWIYKTFHPDNYKEERRLFPHQRLVRDLLQYNSPYRGLLLYHQLGTGKTATSIATAEGFVRKKHKRVVVMVPASLQANYRNEIMRYASVGMPQKKIWAEIDLSKTNDGELLELEREFLKKANLTGKNRKIIFPHSFIRANLPEDAYIRQNVSWNKLSADEKEQAKLVLGNFIDKMYLFVNYNGVTNKSPILQEFYEAIASGNALIVVDEAHNFISRVVNGSKASVARAMYQRIMDSKRTKIVLLTGTPIINHPYEISVLLNLVRGPINIDVYSLLKDGVMPSSPDDVHLVLEEADISDHVDEVILDQNKQLIKIVMKHDVQREQVHRLLMKHYKVGKRVGTEESYALPITKEEFNSMFLDEADPDNPVVKNMDVFSRRINGLVSYLKTVGEQYFPTVHPRRIEQVPMSKFQFDAYSKVRHVERDMDKYSKRKNKAARAAPGVLGSQSSVYRAFSRMACNFVFPDDIKRPFPKDLRQIAKRELDVQKDVDEGHKDEEDDVNDYEAALKKSKQKIAQEYTTAISNALKGLVNSAEDYLSAESIHKKYSPKMKHIFDDINITNGKVLLYSQFRTVEGLGVMKLILAHEGYQEVVLEYREGRMLISNANEVLDPKYNGKRYVTFSGDDISKTKALLELFNCAETNKADVPPSMKEQLEDTMPQLHGEFIKLMMITQSGTEGISLKCVRRVLIMEPFWNMVRLNQVIGRAVRARSHLDLPEDERDVTVSIYTSVFTKEMMKDFTIQTKDFGMTSDQHILQIAEKKDQIIQAFMNQLKAAAVDCMNNAQVNKPTSTGMQCYSYPINSNPDDLAYHAYLYHDIARESNNKHLTRRRQINGKVILDRTSGKKYIRVDDFPNTLFDYAAYKDAGVLVETD